MCLSAIKIILCGRHSDENVEVMSLRIHLFENKNMGFIASTCCSFSSTTILHLSSVSRFFLVYYFILEKSFIINLTDDVHYL